MTQRASRQLFIHVIPCNAGQAEHDVVTRGGRESDVERPVPRVLASDHPPRPHAIAHFPKVDVRLAQNLERAIGSLGHAGAYRMASDDIARLVDVGEDKVKVELCQGLPDSEFQPKVTGRQGWKGDGLRRGVYAKDVFRVEITEREPDGVFVAGIDDGC